MDIVEGGKLAGVGELPRMLMKWVQLPQDGQPPGVECTEIV
jgi:hypothetical protein